MLPTELSWKFALFLHDTARGEHLHVIPTPHLNKYREARVVASKVTNCLVMVELHH